MARIEEVELEEADGEEKAGSPAEIAQIKALLIKLLAHFQKKSWRPPSFALRHELSTSQVYVEIREGRLNARKIGSATIITEEDEAAWLKALPPFETHRSPGPKRKSESAA
jgi:hypothetical protein